MSEEPEFFSYTREEFLDEFVHPDDRPAVEEARQRRALQVRAECLTEKRKKAGLTQAEVAEAMGVSQQRVSAIERRRSRTRHPGRLHPRARRGTESHRRLRRLLAPRRLTPSCRYPSGAQLRCARLPDAQFIKSRAPENAAACTRGQSTAATRHADEGGYIRGARQVYRRSSRHAR